MTKAAAFLLVFLCVLPGCGTEEACHEVNVSGLEKVEDIELKNVIEGYYQAESRELWSVTYRYRTDDFKELVSQDTYANAMSNDNRGYCLKEVFVKEIEHEGDVAVIVMQFIEGKSEDISPPGVSTIRQVERTYFKRSDLGWKVWVPGTRNHLALNRRMIFD